MGSRVKRKRTSRGRLSARRSSRRASDRSVVGMVCFLLAGIVWIAFGQALQCEFVIYDDGSYVYANPRITSGLTPGNVQWAFTHVHAGNWHPLTTISHMLDCQVYGLQPWGHHLTNLLLHAAAAILLFFALRELTGGRRAVVGSGDAGRDQRSRLQLWASSFVAALFAIHPLRVESVAWVAERKDVLSGVFFMLTLLAYARYAHSDRFSLGRYTTVLVLFALGLMCKPTLVTLPFVLLLLDYWPLRRIRDQRSDVGRQVLRLLMEKIPLLALSAVSNVITILVQRGAIGWAEQLPMLARINNALVSYIVYVRQMFWPAHLAVFYPHPENRLPSWEIILAAIVLVGITIAATILRKNAPYFITGWLWYLGMLVPVIGLVQVGWQGHADRYTYLPQIGLYIAGTWAVADLTVPWRRQRILLGAAALVVICALTGSAWIQTSYWRDSETLFTHALAVTTNNDVAQNDLGTVFLQKGDLDQAIAHYKEAVAIKPESAEIQYNLGNALARKGHWADAIASYQAALSTERDSVKAAKVRNNLGAALERLGKSDEALEQFSQALRINESYPEAHCNLGRMLAQRGRRDEAVAHFREALRLKPGYEEARRQLRELGVPVGQ